MKSFPLKDSPTFDVNDAKKVMRLAHACVFSRFTLDEELANRIVSAVTSVSISNEHVNEVVSAQDSDSFFRHATAYAALLRHPRGELYLGLADSNRVVYSENDIKNAGVKKLQNGDVVAPELPAEAKVAPLSRPFMKVLETGTDSVRGLLLPAVTTTPRGVFYT